MTEQQTPTLTPELVVMAVQAGMLDASLPALRDVIRERQSVIAVRKAYELTPGERFIVKDVRPKKWEGLTVTFVRHEGMWLVVHLDEADARRIHNIGMHLTGAALRPFLELKLRHSHVGTIMPKVE